MRTTSSWIRVARALCAAPAVLLSVALSACAEPDADAEGRSSLEESTATLATAGRTLLLQGIGDAENATFSPDGRLFVTGGENAYEIQKRAGVYVAKPLFDGVCNFTGITVRAGTLYTTCLGAMDGPLAGAHLLAAPLAPEMKLKVVYDLKRVGFPNGIAFDDRGRLFVNDFTPLLGKIVALSFDPAAPSRVVREEVWFDLGLLLANGIKVFRGTVYMTDLGQLKAIPIRSDGKAGTARVLASRLAVFDDLYVDDQRILVGDFYGGVLVAYSHTGVLLGETPMVFQSPSSITPAQGPLVPAGTLVVTEKGELGELTSTVGNRVSLYVPETGELD